MVNVRSLLFSLVGSDYGDKVALVGESKGGGRVEAFHLSLGDRGKSPKVECRAAFGPGSDVVHGPLVINYNDRIEIRYKEKIQFKGKSV